MTARSIFILQLILGYVAWLSCFRLYLLPRFKSVTRFEAHRAIAVLHSFRFIGLVFILPGVIGPNMLTDFPSFCIYGAYGDLATGLLAMLAVAAAKKRRAFWFFTVAFNLVGAADFIGDYYLAIRTGVNASAGELGSAYFIPVVFVPILAITHALALYWLLRSRSKADDSLLVPVND
jgi:hypothetical protein